MRESISPKFAKQFGKFDSQFLSASDKRAYTVGLKSFQMIEDKFQQFHNHIVFPLVILNVTSNGIATNFAKMNYGDSTAAVQWRIVVFDMVSDIHW